jgi:hypothetical protein
MPAGSLRPQVRRDAIRGTGCPGEPISPSGVALKSIWILQSIGTGNTNTDGPVRQHINSRFAEDVPRNTLRAPADMALDLIQDVPFSAPALRHR